MTAGQNCAAVVDALLIAAVRPRPVRFVMDHRIVALPVLNAQSEVEFHLLREMDFRW